MKATEPPVRPARSQALDDLIMGTNNSSIVSKRSVERLYYPDEPHYFRYFVKKPQRRAPLINRGYWLRLKAIDVIVRQFLEQPSAKKKVVINLGCGYDVLPWQCHVRYPASSADALFVDVDYPDLMRKKRDVVLQTPELRDLIGQDAVVTDSEDGRVLLRSDKYCQLACDLRELQTFRETLESLVSLEDAQVLFVAEVSITYMDTQSTDSLIHWASSIGQAEFCLLEQLLPSGPDHPFAKTMLAHFDKLKTSLRSVHQYQTLDSQRARFCTRGWQQVELWDLWEAWSGSDFLTSKERRALDDIEPFDEWEELMLFGRHYLVLHATAASPSPEQSLTEPPCENGAVQKINTSVVPCGTTPRVLKRRFGNAVTVSNIEGQCYGVHMLGLGENARSETYDVYALSHERSPSLKLPLSGPLPRMCSTATDLGSYGVLLIGGRSSPAKAMPDCWLLKRDARISWKKVWDLPKPLYRHSAVRFPNSSLALVVGGKTGPADVSSDAFVFHPEKGWLTCQISAKEAPRIFGATLSNSSRLDGKRGVFEGMLSGGMRQDGTLNCDTYWWRLEMNDTQQPKLTFTKMDLDAGVQSLLSVFGASTVDLGSSVAICGGVGDEPSIQGQHFTLLTLVDGKVSIQGSCSPQNGSTQWPFMVGSSVLVSGRHQLTVFGGGAVCFSMGSYWESKSWQIRLPQDAHISYSESLFMEPGVCEYLESPKILGKVQDESEIRQNGAVKEERTKTTITSIPRVRLVPGEDFRRLLRDGKPVVIEGLDLGGCLEKWTPDYMVERVGKDKQVVVHECREDSEKMDFNSKNFQYVTDSFGNVVDRIQNRGGRLYLRSLSHDKPTETPANIAEDFPGLAEDFKLPEEVSFVRDNLFSSVLRVSGMVNMWLHYDVMANVYSQIRGTRRMILFPPSDVSHLSIAPGASSSSLDVFQSIDRDGIPGTHPYEAHLSPGDMLLIPSTWLHTAAPTSEMSVAVNVFFRDLVGDESANGSSAYAAGRDVYGNRDLAAYEKARAEAARMIKGFEKLPRGVGGFYLRRIADELRQAAAEMG